MPITIDWRSNVSNAFLSSKGNVAAAAKLLGINRKTLFQYIKENPHIKLELDDCRNMHSEDELDLAIALNYKFMEDYEANPALASQHVRFTLERKGAARGYQRDAQAEPLRAVNQDEIDLRHELMQVKNELAELKAYANKS